MDDKMDDKMLTIQKLIYDIDSEKKNLQLSLHDREYTIDTLDAENVKKENEIKDLNLKVTSLINELNELKSWRDQFIGTKDESAMKLRAKEKEIENLKTKLDASEKKLSELKKRQSDMALKLKEKDDEIESFNQKVDLLNSSFLSEIREIRNELMEAKEIIAMKDEEITALKFYLAEAEDANKGNDEIEQKLYDIASKFYDLKDAFVRNSLIKSPEEDDNYSRIAQCSQMDDDDSPLSRYVHSNFHPNQLNHETKSKKKRFNGRHRGHRR